MTGGGGPPLKGAGGGEPRVFAGPGPKEISLEGPRDSERKGGRWLFDWSIRGGPESPGGGTTELA